MTTEHLITDYPCQWFALCTNPAAGTVAHPILGSVPTCQRCADKAGCPLDVVPEGSVIVEVPR